MPDPRPSSWTERFLALRDRLLASDAFRRWAAAFPLTRPFARRNARALFDLCAGFVYSQVLSACVRVRLFEILAEGPASRSEIARRIELPLEATERLLRAALSLRLVARRAGDRYGLGMLGAALVRNEAITAMVEHHALLYADLADPVALLRGDVAQTQLARYWPYAAGRTIDDLDPDQLAAYSRLMSTSQALIASEILDAYPLRGHRCLLDVGGGEGAFLLAAAARAPQLDLVLFDLPAVARRAEARFAANGLGRRARAFGGDFRGDALPHGADIATLIRVIFDHDDATALAILRAVRRALPVGGTLLVAEPMAGTEGAEPMGDAYFGFYLLAMGHGRSRTPAELARLIVAAGFDEVRLVRTHMPLQTRLLRARASAGAE
jgi:demethylspheroidene O-methyltransferase